MSRITNLPLALLVLATISVVSAADTPAPAPTTTTVADTTAAPKPVGVDAVVANPKAHSGPIAITGVVSRVFPKTGSFVLIDAEEYAACGELSCCPVTLPIQTPTEEFTGELPQLKDTVVVLGEVTALKKGLKVTVTSVKKGDTIIRQRK